jgi:hypothetical protein
MTPTVDRAPAEAADASTAADTTEEAAAGADAASARDEATPNADAASTAAEATANADAASAGAAEAFSMEGAAARAEAAAAEDTALLARVLLRHALEAFKVVPDNARGPSLAALDRFIAAPGPAAFVGAVRELRVARRQLLIQSHGAGTLRRAFDGGIDAFRQVPGIPSAVADRLATDLPLEALTGPRLQALASLAQAYEELAGRVAADTEEMRRRYQAAPPRKRRPRSRG